MRQVQWDVLIAGGGPAGLSAALLLGQSRRRVLLVDEGRTRNRFARHSHGFLGSDGEPPELLLERGRREVDAAGVERVDGRVERIEGGIGEFTATLADGGTVSARRVIVATGLTDVLPDVPGLVELWGTRVMHCPYCHGVELADRAVAVLALDPWAGHGAVLLTPLTRDLSLVGDVPVSPRDERALLDIGGRVLRRGVRGLEPRDGGGVRVLLDGGGEHLCDAVFLAPRPLPNDALLRGLGCEVTASSAFQGLEYVATGGKGETSVPGVYAAGNAADVSAQVVHAAAEGARTAQAVHTDLLADDLEALRLTRSEPGRPAE